MNVRWIIQDHDCCRSELSTPVLMTSQFTAMVLWPLDLQCQWLWLDTARKVSLSCQRAPLNSLLKHVCCMHYIDVTDIILQKIFEHFCWNDWNRSTLVVSKSYPAERIFFWNEMELVKIMDKEETLSFHDFFTELENQHQNSFLASLESKKLCFPPLIFTLRNIILVHIILVPFEGFFFVILVIFFLFRSSGISDQCCGQTYQCGYWIFQRNAFSIVSESGL